MTQPLLVVDLSKAWSKEARAAAIAARRAKAQGKDPKAAAEAAKEAVREGKDVDTAVKEGVADARKGVTKARGGGSLYAEVGAAMGGLKGGSKEAKGGYLKDGYDWYKGYQESSGESHRPALNKQGKNLAKVMERIGGLSDVNGGRQYSFGGITIDGKGHSSAGGFEASGKSKDGKFFVQIVGHLLDKEKKAVFELDTRAKSDTTDRYSYGKRIGEPAYFDSPQKALAEAKKRMAAHKD